MWEIFAGMRNPGLWNPEYSSRNPESQKQLESWIQAGFRNLGNFCLWNLESWDLESGIQLRESGILLTIKIQTDKMTGIQHLESGIHGLSWIPLMGKLALIPNQRCPSDTSRTHQSCLLFHSIFDVLLKTRSWECSFAHPILLFYLIWLKHSSEETD